MRTDRLSNLRQRLKRGSFEFGALLQGVSTMEGENEIAEPEMATPKIDAPFYEPPSVVLEEVVTEDEIVVVEEVAAVEAPPAPAFVAKPEPVSIVELLPAQALTELRTDDRLR
ncbi:MAG: hypothetical protein ABJA67_09985, partial [Chthonomonadales bacterium]